MGDILIYTNSSILYHSVKLRHRALTRLFHLSIGNLIDLSIDKIKACLVSLGMAPHLPELGNNWWKRLLYYLLFYWNQFDVIIIKWINGCRTDFWKSTSLNYISTLYLWQDIVGDEIILSSWRHSCHVFHWVKSISLFSRGHHVGIKFLRFVRRCE